MKRVILSLTEIYKLVEESYKRKLTEESGSIQKKADFKSVGKNAVNNPEDVKHVIDLFSNEKVGKANEIKEVIKKCTSKESSEETSSEDNESSEDIDYAAVGNCKDFHDFISKYQKEEVFSSGFSDGKIHPNMDTITNLYTKIIGFEIGEKNNLTNDSISKDLDSLGMLAINNVEGGYYHPSMKATLKGGAAMGDSGETIFGLDRKHGDTMNTEPEGIALWNYVDENSGWSEKSAGKTKWAYGFTPSDSKLKQYVIDIIKKYYQKYMSAASISEETKQAIENDSRLKFHMLYSVWNGIGFFNRFAADLNQYIKSNPNYIKSDLLDVALQSRNNTVLRNKAHIIKKIFNSLSA